MRNQRRKKKAVMLVQALLMALLLQSFQPVWAEELLNTEPQLTEEQEAVQPESSEVAEVSVAVDETEESTETATETLEAQAETLPAVSMEYADPGSDTSESTAGTVSEESQAEEEDEAGAQELGPFMMQALPPAAGVEINEENFPDAVFRAHVKQYYDTSGDSILQQTELSVVTQILLEGRGITSFKGIEHFTALQTFKCANNELTTLDVSKNTALTSLSCQGNQLSVLNVDNCNLLQYLECQGNDLTVLDVSHCHVLSFLRCQGNKLVTLNLSTKEDNGLNEFFCQGNNLSALDVSKCSRMWNFNCSYNKLTTLDVSKCTSLFRFDCSNNSLSTLDVSNNAALKDFDCHNNNLTTLDLSANKKLDNVSVLNQKSLTPLYSGLIDPRYQFDLKELVGENVAKVKEVKVGGSTLDDTNYNPLTGILHFDPDRKVHSIRYIYDTRCRDMSVTVDLVYRLIVTYQDERDNVIGQPQIVNFGSDAVPEPVPEKTGHTGEWDHDGRNITDDIVIRPKYTINRYSVTYQDEDNNIVGQPQTVDYGSDAAPETVPEKPGHTGEWDHNGKNITADTVIRPRYVIKSYTVTYLDEDENIVGQPQVVDHGFDAEPETVPEKPGFTAEWNHDGTNIIEDTVIRPVYTEIPAEPTTTEPTAAETTPASSETEPTQNDDIRMIQQTPFWYLDSIEPALFISNADIADFLYVTVDGDVVDESNYELSEGSTVISFKPAYLKTLSVGKHPVAIVSQTGTARGMIEIKAPASQKPTEETTASGTTAETGNTIPKTGESSRTYQWLAIILLAASGLLIVLMRKTSRQRD